MIHASVHKENKHFLYIVLSHCRYWYNDKFNKRFIKSLEDELKHKIKN